jgi:hypothetical protein
MNQAPVSLWAAGVVLMCFNLLLTHILTYLFLYLLIYLLTYLHTSSVKDWTGFLTAVARSTTSIML